MYVDGIAAGRTKKQAAIAAGYSESSANNAAAIIERAAVKAFQGLIQQTIPVKKIIERMAEGLNAMETKCFVHEGGVIPHPGGPSSESGASGTAARSALAKSSSAPNGAFCGTRAVTCGGRPAQDNFGDALSFY
jgi:hypothetical protein